MPSTRSAVSLVSQSRKFNSRQTTDKEMVLLSLVRDNSPYMADHFGRKIPIAVGCLIMILGAFLSGFTNGDGSE